MDELERLGRPGAYRLGMLRAAVAQPERPRPCRPSFARARRRGPASAWVLGFATGIAAVAAGVVAGVFIAAFLVGLLAGLVMRWGGWPPRAVLTSAAVMGAAGWGIPLGWQALRTGPAGAPGRAVAGGLGMVGLPAHGARGVAVALLAGVLQALVAAALGSVLAARAIERTRQRAGATGEPTRPADAGDLVCLLGAHASSSAGSRSGPAGGRTTWPARPAEPRGRRER